MNIPTWLIILLTLIPTVCWLMFYYRMDKKDPEPLGLLLQTFVYGMLGSFLLMGLQYISIQKSGISIVEHLEAKDISTIGITFFLALLEETIKGSMLFILLLRKRKMLNQLIDGIIYGISLALGFAFVENIIYFIQVIHLIGRFDFIITYLFRTVGTMFAHTLFTGIMGYFIAYGMLDAHTHKLIIKKEKGVYFRLKDFVIEMLTFHTLFHHILIDHPSEKGHFLFGIFFESLLLATILHTIFNLLLSTNLYDKNLMFLTVPFLLLLASLLFKKFKDKQAIKLRKTI